MLMNASVHKAAHRIPLCLKDIVTLLRQSADAENLSFGRVIHAHLILSNQSSENHVLENNSLLNFYSKCGQLTTARQLFDRMSKRNVVSWSALMAGYYQNGFASKALRLFKNMVLGDDSFSNEYIFALAISCCSDCGLIEEGRQCHGYVFKSGLIFHQYVKNALVRMYSTSPDVAGAMEVLIAVPGSDIFTYNSMLIGLLDHGYLSEALSVLEMMVGECVVWNKASYVSVFGLCSRVKDLNLGKQVHMKMVKSGAEFDLFVSSAIVDMYGKCCEMSSARKVFDEMQTRNVVSWTSTLAAYLQNGSFEEALKLFIRMKFEATSPNEYTFAVLLNACAGLSALGYGNSLYAHAEKLGFRNYNNVANGLISMYSRIGDIEAAYKVFASVIYRDIITWNSMICGYSYHGLGSKALAVFQEMLRGEEYPNYVTFIGVLTACGHMGYVQEGFYYFECLMKQMGIEPGLEHYTCIVGLLSKAGRLDEAANFMRSSQIKWDVIAWRTLLSACLVHRNYSLGKQVAEVVLHLNPDDEGTYTLLSNMHAKAKRWDGVAKVRKLMRERNIKKEPGLSWIEIRNNTHVFVADDTEHPEASQIHAKVTELLSDLKPLGYVPDIANVLHDVEEEQKEDYLSYHSEKLAVAFALIKTPSKAPVRIIKNLRMCDDCHLAIKLISKVTSRVIIVRDVNRFHHFQDGSCSCSDYCRVEKFPA